MTKGLVSHIQGYSTKDGPGIRTTVFMSECNLRCLWCSNPEAMLPGKKILYYQNKCHHCGACVRHAVNDSIQLTDDGCVIDRKACTNLADMVAICPYDAYESKGTEYQPETLATRLLRDQAFFLTSNGGVTFSGGEPTLQASFVHETIKILKKEKIHIALDTAGLFDFDKIRPLLDDVDLVLYDIKAFDCKLHRDLTGVDNMIILKNAKKIAELNKAMIIRLVIVPTLNDDEADIIKRLNFIKSLGNSVKQVDILKYHKLGIGKYHALGIPYQLEDIPAISDEQIDHLKKLSMDLDLKTTIGG